MNVNKQLAQAELEQLQSLGAASVELDAIQTFYLIQGCQIAAGNEDIAPAARMHFRKVGKLLQSFIPKECPHLQGLLEQAWPRLPLTIVEGGGLRDENGHQRNGG